MKARTFILTAGAALALVVPAANAAGAKSGLYHQAQVHTVLAEKSQVAKSKAAAAERKAMRIRIALNRKYNDGPDATAHLAITKGSPASVASSLSSLLKTPH